MRELQDMLRVQARLHRKQGANALGCLFENAGKEIGSLSDKLAKANERIAELESDNRYWLDKLNFSKSPIEMEILLKERSKQLRKEQASE